jgi:hypothetical protein
MSQVAQARASSLTTGNCEPGPNASRRDFGPSGWEWRGQKLNEERWGEVMRSLSSRRPHDARDMIF